MGNFDNYYAILNSILGNSGGINDKYLFYVNVASNYHQQITYMPFVVTYKNRLKEMDFVCHTQGYSVLQIVFENIAEVKKVNHIFLALE